ncbi:MAG: hypothetical protein NW214_04180 [Pseudanabaenaceae cyanobacterium bins.39]|nr:hypothetical protein [Pseudanabaenaceae cyanobacterium bins.39]
MTFPNSAGYYLPTPQGIESEISNLHLEGLVSFNWEIANFLDDIIKLDDVEFYSAKVGFECERWINNLQPDELINLQRWIGERLAHLYHKQACAKAA